MFFLLQSDFDVAIKAENLDKILVNKPINLDAVVMAAVEEVQSYLRSKFDVADIFNAEGDARNQQIIMYTTDIALYHLHTSIAPRQIPEMRYERYNQAIEWLKGCSKGTIVPNLPQLPTESSNKLQWGSNPKFRFD
jgi:phage gp36-like protein